MHISIFILDIKLIDMDFRKNNNLYHNVARFNIGFWSK